MTHITPVAGQIDQSQTTSCPTWCTKAHDQDAMEIICRDVVHSAELEPTPFGPICLELPTVRGGDVVVEPPLMLFPDTDQSEMTIDDALKLSRALKASAARFQALTA